MSRTAADGTFFSCFWWNPESDRSFYLVGKSGEPIALEAARRIFESD